MSRILKALLLSAYVLVACDAAAEADAVTETVVRDSAGVVIVENRAPGGVAQAPVRLSPEPVVRIGALDGAPEYQFYRVQAVTRLSDGTIVIADEGSSEIRFFDADGTFRVASGRPGQGPGEFQTLSYMRRLSGDTVMVFDGRSRRITLISPAGTFARDFTPTASGEQAPLNVAGALRDGTLLSRAPLSVGEMSSGLRRDTASYSLTSPRGESVPLARLPGSESLLNVNTSGGEVTSVEIARIPFARAAYAAAGPSHFHLGASETFEIRRYDRDGRLVTVLRSGHVPVRPVTDALIRRYADDQIEQRHQAGVGAPAEDAALRERIEGLPRVPALPFFGTILADEADRLWVREYALPGSRDAPHHWTLFDAEGRLQGTVEMPRDFRPLHVDEEVVVGVARDALDVEYVQVHRLEDR